MGGIDEDMRRRKEPKFLRESTRKMYHHRDLERNRKDAFFAGKEAGKKEALAGIFFPIETLNWMIARSSGEVEAKLVCIEFFSDVGKQNRWFGYYQKVGEDLDLWTLDELIVRVRAERKEWEGSN